MGNNPNSEATPSNPLNLNCICCQDAIEKDEIKVEIPLEPITFEDPNFTCTEDKFNEQNSMNIFQKHLVPVKAFLEDQPIINVQALQTEIDTQTIVPSNILQLLLPIEIKRQIREVNPSFLPENNLQQEKFKRKWKISKSGHYYSFVSDGNGFVVDQSCYYQGEYVIQDGAITMHGEGIFITKEGKYVGAFKDSKAAGIGTMTSIKSQAKFTGFWKNGMLAEGNAVAQHYNYKGTLASGVPDGQGLLVLPSKKVKYTGPFCYGKFQGTNGLYECKDYIYKGNFSNGKKNGEGTISFKENCQKEKKTEFKKNDILGCMRGIWLNDKLIEEF